jgi:hypothetical protein
VNWSALEIALVPLGVVTVTSTVPVPAGTVTVIDVPVEFTTTFVAGTCPKVTDAPVRKFEPAIVTVDPDVEEVGVTLVTSGSAPIVMSDAKH